LTESDFERIEAAVQETERGRWFLAEYARRLRAVETNGLLAALSRMQRTLDEGELARSSDHIRRLEAKLESVYEGLRDLAWRLQERGLRLEEASAPVLSYDRPDPSCALAAPTQPDAEGAHEAPARERHGAVSVRLQSIGAMDQCGAAGASPSAASRCEQPSDPDPRLAVFAAIDSLSLEEKLRFFA